MLRLGVSKRELLSLALDCSGLNRMALSARRWNGLLVLNYHRIGQPNGTPFDWELWSASAEQFDRQVAYLTKHCNVVGIDDLEEVLQARSGRHVMITFDDGYRDNYELAFPILQAHNAPAVFFIATGFVERPHIAWWDEIAWMVRNSSRPGLDANPWTILPITFDRPNCSAAVRQLNSCYKTLRGEETGRYLDFLAESTGSGRCPASFAEKMWMTWDMIREMQQAGMGIGGHTVGHPVLARLEADEQDREIEACTCHISAALGRQPVAFSYPVGGPTAFNEVSRACLARHGYRWAFSYHGGYSQPGRYDAFDLPRVAVERDLSHPMFRSLGALPQIFA